MLSPTTYPNHARSHSLENIPEVSHSSSEESNKSDTFRHALPFCDSASDDGFNALTDDAHTCTDNLDTHIKSYSPTYILDIPLDDEIIMQGQKPELGQY